MQPCFLTCATSYITECSKIQQKELLCLWMKPTQIKKNIGYISSLYVVGMVKEKADFQRFLKNIMN